MQLNPYLTFKGQCEAAFKFYAECIGGKITTMLRCADMPSTNQMPPEMRDKIMHARLLLGNTELMGSDAPAAQYEEMKGSSISLTLDNSAEAERVFKALSENGTVRMPLGQTFFAARFGMLNDQFGVSWMIGALPNT